jgi:hypothetical protein
VYFEYAPNTFFKNTMNYLKEVKHTNQMPKSFTFIDSIVLSTFAISSVYLVGTTQQILSRMYIDCWTRPCWLRIMNETLMGIVLGSYLAISLKAIVDITERSTET